MPASHQDNSPPPLRTICTRPIVVSIANYGALALMQMAFLVLMPLFLSAPIALGGLGLEPATIGTILGAVGLLDGVVQALFLARVVNAFGENAPLVSVSRLKSSMRTSDRRPPQVAR